MRRTIPHNDNTIIPWEHQGEWLFYRVAKERLERVSGPNVRKYEMFDRIGMPPAQ